MKSIAVFGIVLAIAAVSSAGDVKRIDEARAKTFPVALDDLTVIRLLHLDPIATRRNPPSGTPRFHDWVVAADSVKVAASSSDALVLSMRAIVDAAADGMAACFAPHHGAILSDGHRTFDVVVCFECARYEVFDADGKRVWGGSFTVAGTEGHKWNRIFRESGLGMKN